MKYVLSFIVLLIGITYALRCQTDEQKEAYQIGMQAIEEMNNGNYNRAIDKLDSAIALDSASILYPYEKALCYYKLEEYENAIKLLDSLKDHEQVFDMIYQILGNSHDFLGEKEAAIDVYNEGLEKFPNSGRLYQELGITEFGRERMRRAVGYWEQGIKVDPMYPKNYYRLAKHYSKTAERMWGIIYGELFQILSDGTRKIEEISGILYGTYSTALFDFMQGERQVKLTGLKIRTNRKMTIAEKPFRLVYQSAYKAVDKSYSEKIGNEMNFESVTLFRKKFLEEWFSGKYTEHFDIALFDYQKKILDAGYFDVYSHWSLQIGNYSAYKDWLKANKKKLEEFKKWLKNNPIELDRENAVVRSKYN